MTPSRTSRRGTSPTLVTLKKQVVRLRVIAVSKDRCGIPEDRALLLKVIILGINGAKTVI